MSFVWVSFAPSNPDTDQASRTRQRSAQGNARKSPFGLMLAVPLQQACGQLLIIVERYYSSFRLLVEIHRDPDRRLLQTYFLIQQLQLIDGRYCPYHYGPWVVWIVSVVLEHQCIWWISIGENTLAAQKAMIASLRLAFEARPVMSERMLQICCIIIIDSLT